MTNELKSLEVIYDDRTGCEGWYARATESASDGTTQDRDIPLECEGDASDEDLADEARIEARMDTLLSCDVPEDFPVKIGRRPV